MMMRRFVNRLAGAVFLLSTLAVGQASAQACKPTHNFSTINPGVLTVTTGPLPPFDVIDGTGNYSGIDADVLRLFAAKQCLTLKPVVVDPSAMIQYVVSGRADMSALNWWRSAARAKVPNIGAPMFLERMAMYSKDGYSSLSQLKGKKVGTMQGYLWVQDLKAVLGDSLVLYPNQVNLAQDLQAGRIDVGIDSYTKGIYAQRTAGAYPGLQIKVTEPDPRVAATVEPAQTGFLVTKSNEALLKAVNDTVEELQRSGELERIVKKYGLDPSMAQVGAPRLVGAP